MSKHPSVASNCSECGQALLRFDHKSQLDEAKDHITTLEAKLEVVRQVLGEFREAAIEAIRDGGEEWGVLY